MMTDDLLNNTQNLTLKEVCDYCNLKQDVVVAYVEEGLIDIAGNTISSWRFSEIHLLHIQKASRLERDLRLNPAGSVLALELMREIEKLKNKLRCFQRQESENLD
jgi:chaperone modulatory protein CbpM